MRRLNLDQLETLLAVLRLGSFSAAARELNLSQPAISHQIRELEDRVGVRLVDRVGKVAMATEAGRELVVHAGALLRDADTTMQVMNRFREGGRQTVRIGTANNVIVWILPKILKEIQTRAPNIAVSIHADWTASTVDRIVANELDVGLVTLPVPAGAPIDVIDWRDEPAYALFSAARQDIPDLVTPTLLARERLILPRSYGTIRQLIDAWFATEGIVVEAEIELSNSEAIKALVSADVGVTVLPGEYGEQHGHGRLVARPVAPSLTRKLAIVTRRHREPEPANRIFIETLMAARNG